jgi:hypothetical protein
LGALLFLINTCILVSKSVAGFPATHAPRTIWPWLADKPVGEDGFYMLTVADNLAVQHHLVYNQNMPATGIQPLSTLIFAGIALTVHFIGGDRWTLVRAIILIGSVSLLLFSWMLASITSGLAPPQRRDLTFIIAFFLTLFNFTTFHLFTYGLETGIYLCLITLCMIVWRRIVLQQQARWIDMVTFGAIAGLAGLARIDFGLLFIVLLAFLLLKRIAKFLQILISGLVALVIVSPWFILVHRLSGDWLPSSGKAESSVIDTHQLVYRFTSMIVSLTPHVAPWSFAGSGHPITTAVGLVSLVLLVILFPNNPLEIRLALRSSNNFRATFLPWMLGIGALIFLYVCFFWSTHFYTRYFAPILIVSSPLLALALSEWGFLQLHKTVIPVAMVFFFCLWDISSLYTGHVRGEFCINSGYINAYYPNVMSELEPFRAEPPDISTRM